MHYLHEMHKTNSQFTYNPSGLMCHTLFDTLKLNFAFGDLH
jgi:hypothetical protein